MSSAVVLVALLVSGCDHQNRLQSDLSFSQAQARARSLAAVAKAALPDGARLVNRDPVGITAYCGGGEDPPKGTPVEWSTTYDVQGVEVDRGLLGDFEKHYRGLGWDVRAVGDTTVGAENRGHFTLVLTVSDVKVSLAVEGPCVKPADPDHPLDP